MTRFSKWQKLAMVCLPLAIMLNPLTVQIYLEYVIWFLNGVSILATGYLLGFMLYKVLKPEKVNIPPKGKKTKAQKYIDIDPKV